MPVGIPETIERLSTCSLERACLALRQEIRNFLTGGPPATGFRYSAVAMILRLMESPDFCHIRLMDDPKDSATIYTHFNKRAQRKVDEVHERVNLVDSVVGFEKLLIPIKAVSDSDLNPVTCSDAKPITIGAKRRWRSYPA